MSPVTTEDVVAVLTEARARHTALATEFAEIESDFNADPSMVNWRRYYMCQADLEKQASRLSLLELWAAGLGVEVSG